MYNFYYSGITVAQLIAWLAPFPGEWPILLLGHGKDGEPCFADVSNFHHMTVFLNKVGLLAETDMDVGDVLTWEGGKRPQKTKKLLCRGAYCFLQVPTKDPILTIQRFRECPGIATDALLIGEVDVANGVYCRPVKTIQIGSYYTNTGAPAQLQSDIAGAVLVGETKPEEVSRLFPALFLVFHH